MGVDEVDGLSGVLHHLHGQDVVAKLGVPVRLTGGLDALPQNGAGPGAAPQLHIFLIQQGLDLRQEGLRRLRVDQQAFGRVAHRGTGGLGVVNDPGPHIQVGLPVHIDVAHPHAGLDDRHPGIFHHRPDEARAPPGDEHVQIAGEPHELLGAGPAGVLHQGHAVPGQARRLQSVPHDRHKCLVGAEGLLAPPEDDGVARLEAEGGGIHSDVGPGLVDDADDAQGHPALADHQAVGPFLHPGDAADGVGQRGHLPHPLHNTVDALGAEGQPIQQRRLHAALPGGGQVLLVLGQDSALSLFQRPGHGFQRPVLLGGARYGQHPLGVPGRQALGLQNGHGYSLLFSALRYSFRISG